MRMPFGKYKGVEIPALPLDYLEWIVKNFEPGEIRNEAEKFLKSQDAQSVRNQQDLEAQANRLLGEKPISNLRRGFRRPRYRRKGGSS